MGLVLNREAACSKMHLHTHPTKARQASPHGVQPDGHVGYAGEDVRCPLKIVVVAHAMPLRQAARC